MNQWSTEPEYILENPSEKIIHSSAQSKDMDLNSMVQVVAELRLLSQELSMAIDISGRIRDSVHVLLLSLEERL